MFSRLLILATVTFLTASATFSDQIPKYDRDLFGGWSDTDRDCQNMRHELLQDLSTATVSFHKTPAGLLEADGLIPIQTKYSMRAVC